MRQVRSRSALTRADPGTALLAAAANRPCRVPPAASSCAWAVRVRTARALPRSRCGQAAMRLSGDEERSARAARAARFVHLTCRTCPSAARKRVASCAPGQGCEHRQGQSASADRRTEASRPALRRLRRHSMHAQRTFKAAAVRRNLPLDSRGSHATVHQASLPRAEDRVQRVHERAQVQRLGPVVFEAGLQRSIDIVGHCIG